MRSSLALAMLWLLASAAAAQPAAPRPSPAYLLTSGAGPVFQLPVHMKLLRVLTTASLAPGVSTSPAQEWRYAVRYELLGPNQVPLASRVYHVRTRGLDSRSFLLALDALPQRPARLRLSLESAQQGLQEVTARVHGREETTGQKLDLAWQRLSPEKRAQLAKATAYPAELLTEEERRELLRFRWAPLGPQGVEGRDYALRMIQEQEEAVPAPTEPSTPIQGLPSGPGLAAVLPVPATSFELAVEVSPPAALRWYGERPGDEKSWTVSGPVWRGRLPPGVLEVRAIGPSFVRAFLEAPSGRQELAAEPLRVESWLPLPGSPLEFAISHVGEAATPIRVDLRSPEPGKSAPEAVFAWLDAAGQVSAQGAIAGTATPSAYDWLAAPEGAGALTEPVSHFFEAPPGLKRLQIGPRAGPVLVTVYNRPPGPGPVASVPEDRARTGEQRLLHRSWFPLAPEGREQLEAAARRRPLRIQPRPPEIAAEETQRYWEPLLPGGRWRGRYLLLAAEPDEAAEERAAAWTYAPVPANAPFEVELLPPPGRQLAPVRLLYLAAEPAWRALRLEGPNQAAGAAPAPGIEGEVTLGAVRRGRHALRVKAPDRVRLFAGNARPGMAGNRVERLAIVLEPPGPVFHVEKAGPAPVSLAFRYFAPAGRTQRVGLQVSVKGPKPAGPGPRPAWTFTERLFDIAPAGGQASPVLSAGGRSADSGQPFFLRLGPDLPRGRYEVRIVPRPGTAGYLTASRSAQGRREVRRVFLVSNDDPAESSR